MRVYHASTLEIRRPRIVNRFATLDFGTGFYTTLNEEQARDFACKVFARRGRDGCPTVNIYEVDLNLMRERLSLLEFEAPDRSWLEFVVHNRRYGRSPECTADVVIGPVANDDVFQTVALYEAGQIDEDAAIARFKVKNLFNQVLFCNDAALSQLSFVGSYVVEVTS